MAKLYFRHGAVSSAKTLNLLAVSHNYKTQGKEILLMKPALDVRFGEKAVKSRAGLVQDADVLIAADTDLLAMPEAERRDISCVLVDEAQFLSPKHIDQLRTMSLVWKVPVIAYGLRTDFRANLFPGSRRLMEVADTIEEVKTTCNFCNKKAVLNLKHVNGVADTQGPAVQLGAEEKYFPACFGCYRSACKDAGQLPMDSFWVETESGAVEVEAEVPSASLSLGEAELTALKIGDWTAEAANNTVFTASTGVNTVSPEK
jgi:thymidine kinase